MSVTINGTTGITTPDVTSDSYTGPLSVSSSAPDNSVVVDASGNLGVGTSSPAYKLDVQTAAGRFQVRDLGGSSVRLMNSTTGGNIGLDSAGGVTLIYANGTERARIDSSGNLLVGTTTAAAKLSVEASSNVASFWHTDSSDTIGVYMRHGRGLSGFSGKMVSFRRNDDTEVGSIVIGASSTSYNTSSDYRLKENIQPMQGALATVALLNPVTHNWKADGSAGQGFIAHELQAVVPNCVTGEKDAVDAEGNPQYQGVDTSFLVATLTAAIKELKAELDAVKAELKGAAQ